MQSPVLALELLRNASNEPHFSGTRHQQALLKLASMWLQNGHPQLAMTAVEEAMKSAHQRGDHASVARALLLLHHVVIGMQTQINGSEQAAAAYRHVQGVSPEEVLQRCLDRCSSLGWYHTSSLALTLTYILSNPPDDFLRLGIPGALSLLIVRLVSFVSWENIH